MKIAHCPFAVSRTDDKADNWIWAAFASLSLYQPLVVTQTSVSHQAGISNEAFIRQRRDPEVTRTPQEKHCGTFNSADVVGGKQSRRQKKNPALRKKKKKEILHVRCWKCFSCSINYSAARRRNTFLMCLKMKKQKKLIDLLRSFGST